MKRSVFIILLIIVFAAAVAATFYFVQHKNQQIIFFYRNQCPHCEKVEAFFQAHNVRAKIPFASKEVSANRRNLMQLVKIEKHCGMSVKDSVEIPVLWTGSNCIVGDQNIIKFFQGEITK
ncbi:MAG: hypothetical protein KAT71_06065 [Gammaproteobacteria bacterium]|nr:hypothetical protein [Gammaproteobacteria bacterium]